MNTVAFTSFLCSTLLLLSMTFDRFYSVIRPHKAASFNTVKRSKITIVCIFIIGVTYNLPHLFISDHENWQCLPYGAAMGQSYGQFYYWMSFVLNYALPFVLLLSMNSVIIHKIRRRAIFTMKRNSTEDHNTHAKSSERQIFGMLLLVTFAFLILTTPGYLLFLFIMVVDFFKTPHLFAGYYLFYSVAQKLHTTNHGINFFLYVISGEKFRTDLLNLLRIKTVVGKPSNAKSTGISPAQEN